MRYNVFLSYSRKDTPFAEKICRALDQADLTYFIDRKGIDGGDEFLKLITTAIDNSDIVLFLASENSYKSFYSIKEVNYAIHTGSAKVIPYIIDGSELPPTLKLLFADINWRTLKNCPISPNLIQDIKKTLSTGEDPLRLEDENKKSFRPKWWMTLPLLAVSLCAAFFFIFKSHQETLSPENEVLVDTLSQAQTGGAITMTEDAISETLTEEKGAPLAESSNQLPKAPSNTAAQELPTRPNAKPSTTTDVSDQGTSDRIPTMEDPTEEVEIPMDKVSVPEQNESSSTKPKESAVPRSGVRIDGRRLISKSDIDPRGGDYSVSLSLESGSIEPNLFSISTPESWYSYTFGPVDSLNNAQLLTIHFERNATRETRYARIHVWFGNDEARMELDQNCVPTALYANDWYLKVLGLLADPSAKENNSCKYRGALKNGNMEGYGLCEYNNGTLYIGYQTKGHRNGRGIYILRKGHSFFSGDSDCRIQVSDFLNDVENGQTSCYNKYGKLVYEGPIVRGDPTGDYPTPNANPNKGFDYLSFTSGDWFLGETRNGKMHGFGLYVSAAGSCWVGFFRDGEKSDGDFI